jgi:hypothetical protein
LANLSTHLCPTASAEPSCRCHRRPNRRSQPPACENVREWREYNNIQAALRKQLLNAVEDVLFPPSRDPLTGYNNLSVHDILKHLFTSYGKIPPSRASQNAQDLYKPWDANTPFEHLIKQIQDCRDIAAAPTNLSPTNRS